MKKSKKLISVSAAIAIAILFVSLQKANKMQVKKSDMKIVEKIQPQVEERTMVVENDIETNRLAGVR